MNPVLRTLFAAIVIVALAAASAHAADRGPGDPADTVKASTERIQKIVSGAADHAKMLADLQAEMASIVDYDAFAKRTLKKGWPGLDAAQRARFVASFKQLLINTYARRFKPGTTFRLEMRGTTTFRDGDPASATVKTTIHGDKAAADVDYLFQALPDADGKLTWRGVDITIDEASMALGWRKRFTRLLNDKGFDALITKIDAVATKASKR